MKKILMMLFCLFTFIGINAQSIDVNKEDLHPKVINFIDTHFSDVDIVYCSVEYNTEHYHNVDEIEVKFANGTKVEFDKYSNLKSVECVGHSFVPVNILPKEIIKYVIDNYPNANVIGYSINRNNRSKIIDYEVDLSNHHDLTFNKKFKCVEIEVY
jgi:hypothetical protein